ncbi:MAG: putative drug exporter of the superfamily, partial [Gaiellales bacterium]|nr:putative drug exporter of the superfamily [Gaiellales bacterium]
MNQHISPDAGRNRPATGALADFARKCANHPRRVLGIWFLATVALVALTVVAHGTLVNEFKLPGSDTQRASDLLKAKFPAQNGSSLTYVFQAKPGQKITSPTNKAAIEKIIGLSKKAQYATRTTSPFTKGNLSNTGRVGYFDQSFSKQSFDLSWTKT